MKKRLKIRLVAALLFASLADLCHAQATGTTASEGQTDVPATMTPITEALYDAPLNRLANALTTAQ